MRIVPTDGWQERYAKALRREGWTLHPPGHSCVGTDHVFKGRQDTSFAASVYMAPRSGTIRKQVLDQLKQVGPATDVELQRDLVLSPNTERPRRVELVEGGFVRDSGHRRRHHGKEHIVWEAVR